MATEVDIVCLSPYAYCTQCNRDRPNGPFIAMWNWARKSLGVTFSVFCQHRGVSGGLTHQNKENNFFQFSDHTYFLRYLLFYKWPNGSFIYGMLHMFSLFSSKLSMCSFQHYRNKNFLFGLPQYCKLLDCQLLVFVASYCCLFCMPNFETNMF